MSDSPWLPGKDRLGNYVYLAALQSGGEEEKKLANSITSQLDFKENLNNNGINFFDKINQILIILEDIQKSEEAKERASIARIEKKIEEILNQKEFQIPTPLKNNLIKQLNLLKFVPSQGTNPSDFKAIQADLIMKINVVHKYINTFERRINEIQRNLIEMEEAALNGKNITNLGYGTIEVNIVDWITPFLINSISSNQTMWTVHAPYDRIISNGLKQLIKNSAAINSLLDDKDPGFEEALLAILYIDFAMYATDTNSENLYNLNEATLKRSLTDYIKKNSSVQDFDPTVLITGLIQNIDESIQLIKEMQEFLGISYLSRTEIEQKRKELKQEKERLKELLKKEKEEISDKEIEKKVNNVTGRLQAAIETAQQKIKIVTDKKDKRRKNRFSISWIGRKSKSTIYGEFYEILNRLLQGSLRVRQNVGVDNILPIGTLDIIIDPENKNQTLSMKNDHQERKILNEAAKEIDQIFNKYISEKSSFESSQNDPIENFKKIIEREQLLSKNIEEALDTSASGMAQLYGELTQSFLSFESLKNYPSQEKSLNEAGAHGREQKILNALGQLYASSSLAREMIPYDILFPFLLNVGTATLGADNKNDLETYLSLFAGILMFDDISRIAEDALVRRVQDMKQLNSGNTEVLHVFLMNGIYVPLSVILTNLITQVREGLNDVQNLILSPNATATASIKPPGRNLYIIQGVSGEEKWKALATQVINNTTLKITFLAGFLNWVKKTFIDQNF